ncbi:MAG TPA: DJ-1/PfpI family protein [Nocardioidaceae bacterium]|nr:DJ-1/PfpI family protein [Nocardioidaceae bacterium]
MQIAILLFEQVTALDAVGPYEVLSRMPGARAVFVGERVGPVRTDLGTLALHADATLEDVTRPDLVVVPGGIGQQGHMLDGVVHDWLRTVDRASMYTTAVCTGSLILAAAGLLEGRRATSHWVRRDDLAQHGAIPTEGRVVFDGKYVTAAGVSAGIDMGLTLAGRIAGDERAHAIQCGIEYDPQPPYDAGSPDKVDPRIVEELLSYKDLVF